MELIVINPNKLKIMLSAPDMARYELESTHMDCADAHTRAAFRHIFDDARAEIGFDTQGERLFVQLYASKEGGCEIFVTKLGSQSEGNEWESGERELLRRICGEEEDMTANRSEHRLSTVGARRISVAFRTMEDILVVCRRLLREGYRGRSAAYIDEGRDTVWYLFLDIPDVTLYRLPLPFAFLTEYGVESPAGEKETYLAEHGRVLCSAGAVETLGKL